MNERIATFEGHEHPPTARPSLESFGVDARPLDLVRSSVLRTLETVGFSMDIDGLSGHFPVLGLATVLRSPAATLMKTAKAGKLGRSKYRIAEDGVAKKISDMLSLEIMNLTSPLFGVVRFHLMFKTLNDASVLSYSIE